MNEKKRLIPRTIWLLWYQGVSEAPFLVRQCIDSWVRENPTWDVVVLDSGNLNKYVNLNLPESVVGNLSLALQSDLVRLALLSKYGGVWADATTFCTKPLDHWIDDYSASGFFVFHRPRRERLMSSWFIASEKECPLISTLYEQLRQYLNQNKFKKPNRIQRKIRDILRIILNRSDKTTKYWFNPIVTKLFKVCPYCAFHYMFERVVSIDDESKTIWRNTRGISADHPHLIRKLGFFSRPSQSIRKQIKESEAPLFKLSWKYDSSRYLPDTLLYYLLEERESQII